MSRASTSPCMPSSRGTENPQMSASSTPMVRPRRARATARLTVTELLPDPALARGDGDDPGRVGDVGGRGRVLGQPAGPGHDRLALVGVHHPGGHRRPTRTPARAPTWVSTSLWIWVRRGQPATVRATSTSTVPSVADADGGDHAQLDDVGAQLGIDHPPEGGADRVLGGAGSPVRPDVHRSEVSDLLTLAILPAGPGGPPDGMYHRRWTRVRWGTASVVPGPIGAIGAQVGVEIAVQRVATQEERR